VPFLHSTCVSGSAHWEIFGLTARLTLRLSPRTYTFPVFPPRGTTIPEPLADSPRFPIGRLTVHSPQDIVDRRLRTTPAIYSNDMNRARKDEWPVQPPPPPYPYPPTSTSQQTGTYNPERMRHLWSDTPTYPHPQSGNGDQLPPIRNLVPDLWEPGTSRSSQQIASDEGKNGSSVYRFHPVGPAWNGGPINANDRHIPRPQPVSSPVERADHTRTAPPDGIINSNGGTINRTHKQSQTSNEKPDVLPRSNSDGPNPMGESPGSGSQSSHQQELLRDPVGMLWSRFTHN
jgi:hypothetical protein